jgi:catecholate siderophore receptor
MTARPPIAAALLAALLTPGAALAEVPAPAPVQNDGPNEVSGVVVTGLKGQGSFGPSVNALDKLPADPHDLSQSMTVVDTALMQSSGATSLADALRLVPGVTLGAAEGGQIGNNINLNGFTARTDIYLDGFRDRGQYYRDTFALKEVEVLMGPSSMLFGRGSTGGVIDQVSKTPMPKPFTEVTGAETTNGLGRATIDENQPFSAAAAGRIELMVQSGAPTTRTDVTLRDMGAAPSVAFGMGTDTQVLVTALLQHNRDAPDYGLPPLNGHPIPINRFYGFSDDRTIQDILATGVSVSHDVAKTVQVRNRVQLNTVDTDARETAPNAVGTVGPGGFSALSLTAISTLPLDTLWVRQQSHDRQIRDWSLFDQAELSTEVQTGPIAHTLLAGLELGHDDYRNQGFYRNGSCDGVALNPSTGTSGYVGCEPLIEPVFDASPTSAPSRRGNLAQGRADTQAVYVNDTLAIGKHFDVVAGVRLDDYAAQISNSLNLTNTPGATSLAAASQRTHYASVRTGAIYKPTSQQSYYVSYSTSFDPSLEQLTSTTGLTQPLPPETNKAYEAGGKWDLAHSLALSAAVFQITQYNARSQNADNTYTADGTVRVNGARIGASGRITRTWQVFGGWTWLDGRIVDAIAPGTLGKVPLNTPRQTATLWTTWEPVAHVETGAGVVYMSSRFANNADLTEVPAYARYDASVAWRHPRWDLRLNLFNLTDVRYFDALIASDGGRAVPGTGRTAMLSFIARP